MSCERKLPNLVAVCVIAAGAAAITGPSAGAAVLAPAANHVTYDDPCLDATGGAPDLVEVTVTSDDSGIVTFSFSAPASCSNGFVAGTGVSVYVDADRNAATGDGSGADVLLRALVGGSAELFRWTAAGWAPAAVPPSLAAALEGASVTLTVSPADLGVSTGFAFRVESVRLDENGSPVGTDDAPSGNGVLQFELTPPPLPAKPVIGAPGASAGGAVVGAWFSVAFRVTRSDTRKPLVGGRIATEATIGGAAIPHTQRFADGTARLSLLIPNGAAGRELRVRLTITLGGRSATRVASFRIAAASAGVDGRLVYRYYVGAGYQFNPLLSFANLNHAVSARNVIAVRQLTAALDRLGVRRGDSLYWPYGFSFGAGRPGWISGFAQIVAAQALARAAVLLDDPSLARRASASFRALQHGLLMSLGGGIWVREYSFTNEAILNAQLQSLLSLESYARVSRSAAAARLAARFEVASRTLLPRFDLGCWSRYELGGGAADAHYQAYHVALLRQIGATHSEPVWRATYARWSRCL